MSCILKQKGKIYMYIHVSYTGDWTSESVTTKHVPPEPCFFLSHTDSWFSTPSSISMPMLLVLFFFSLPADFILIPFVSKYINLFCPVTSSTSGLPVSRQGQRQVRWVNFNAPNGSQQVDRYKLNSMFSLVFNH